MDQQHPVEPPAPQPDDRPRAAPPGAGDGSGAPGAPSGPVGGQVPEAPGPSGEEREDSSVRVLIVDDHPLFREGLRAALESAEGIAVVAEAERVGEVAAAVARSRPDVVVMDLSLPDGSGLEAARPSSPSGSRPRRC